MKLIYNLKKILNNIKKTFRNNGSGTLVVIISSLIFVMYASSTYADVRHLKHMEEQYEKKIIEVYAEDVNNVESEYDRIL